MKRSEPLWVTSLEHSIWSGLHTDLECALNRLGLLHLSAPSMLILHDLIDQAVLAMHRHVFMRLAEADFGMSLAGNEETLADLYDAEVSEHGSQNIARYCQENGWRVAVDFPPGDDVIVAIDMPVRWDLAGRGTARLSDALAYRLIEQDSAVAPQGCLVTLKRPITRHTPLRLGGLLDERASLDSAQRIAAKLGHGIIRFSSAGEVIAASPAMLASAKLELDEAALTRLCAAIPFHFYNDVIWGLVLSSPNGIFENYRIRIHLGGDGERSILYNVSGYRDEAEVIHTLWQVVSLEDGGANLTEGSILNEVRLHKITRNYVPQLVEEKAREAVRLGKDKLTNEECFVAVLFCDIVGFTSYVESNAGSESIINTLNTILRNVSGPIKRHHGNIDKFMGDSVMAIFKDPADAIRAALDMQSHSSDINSLRSRAGQDTLRLRIGIHCGDVVIGNVGTAERLDWTVIGDVVNTASRIEKNCNPGAILVSQAMRDAMLASAHPGISFGAIFPLMVKGKRAALSVCHINHPDDQAAR